MARSGKKRKHYERESNAGGYSGVAQFKSPPPSASSPPPSPHANHTDDGDGASEWQTVKSKKPKKTNYPTLVYSDLHRLQRIVKLGDWQSLLLYCLADGPAPHFVSVRHHNDIQKAVVLLVPGLERCMFDCDASLDVPVADALAGQEDGGRSQDVDMPNGSHVVNNARANRIPATRVIASPDDFLPVKLNSASMPELLKPLADMFEYLWPLRAPGDDHRVHSPLQAMLQSPMPKSRAEREVERKTKGAKPVHGTEQWVDKHTSIVEYVLKSEGLIENDYVLHPSCWEPAGLDREQQLERRRAAKQTVEDGWVDTDVMRNENLPEQDQQQRLFTNGRRVLAVDCEMCIVQGGKSALTRISVLDWNGKQVMDELVKPALPIIDYLTPYSGIRPEAMAPITTTLPTIQSRLSDLITPTTILIGHSLESDLTALQLTHPHIVDTSLLYPHPRGPPMKSSLKWLAQKYLSREIQRGHGITGHSSIEDALAVLDLVKMKCQRGPRWGTPEAIHEPVFKRLKRCSKPGSGAAGELRGCIIDHGDPGAGYGRMADYALGCNSDEEVVQAVARAVKGDDDGLYIPGGGVALTWARMRELEELRGWRDDLPPPTPALNGAAAAMEDRSDDKGAKTLASALARTVDQIKRIRDGLPQRTLLIVYSGTGDPRAMRRLNERKRKYARLMKEGVKWDEMETEQRWTDDEELALKETVKRARDGVGFMGIT